MMNFKLAIPMAVSAFVLTGCMTSGPLESADQIPPGTETVQLAIGETKRIDAYRAAECGAPPPSWATVRALLPPSSIVRYSDGGPAVRRNSRSCGGDVPTRAVNGTGIASGVEINQYSDRVAIIVE